MAKPDEGISNGQRALWTFLLYMLIAPFFGALAAVVLLAVGILLGQAPGPFGQISQSDAFAQLGPIGVTAFVWSVIPAALTAIAVLPTVLKHGTLGWFMAGAVGVICFTAAILLFPFPTGGFQPVIAFLAGLIAVFCRNLLIRAGILKREAVA